LNAVAAERADFVALSSSVLKIEVVRQQGGYSLGSGVVVADEKVVTNCHVTRDARAIRVLRHGERLSADQQSIDMAHDLCVLNVPGLHGGVLPLSGAASLRVGQKVTAVGFTGGLGIQAIEGNVVALHRLDGAPVVQSSNWFSSGASGGALLDEDLRLVGILTFRMRGGEAHYFSAPVEWLGAALTDTAIYAAVAPINDGELPYWQRPTESQPEFLQAATLTHAARWPELRVLAQRWLQSAANTAQPWLSRGVADEALERSPDALEAYERAVAIDPGLAHGWLRLGLLSAKLGLKDRARQALEALEPLSADLARQLASRLALP